MVKNKAIVTLIYGKKYQDYFKKFCEKNWKEYANKFGYDIVLFDRLLDKTERALNRSPAWQKCLVLSHGDLDKYEQIVWIDSDIIINSENSPSIVKNVPVDKVGTVDAYSILTRKLYYIYLKRRYNFWSKHKISYINNLTAKQYYSNYGLKPVFDRVVQTGVLVCSPKYHKNIFTRVYNNYEEIGGSEWNYEMRPLSYELIKENLIYWIDYRFNYPWGVHKILFYPFLFHKKTFYEKVLYKMDVPLFLPGSKIIKRCATTAYHNSFFLHFTGSMNEMRYVNTSSKSVFGL